jgi:hypothetical protein
MIDSRVQVHGMPPSDFDSQREWYREALRDSLRVAARTKKVSNIKGKSPQRQNNMLAPSGGSRTGPSTVGGLDYNVSTPQVLQTPIMDNNVPNMHLLQPNYHPGTQPHVMQSPWGMGTNMQDNLPIDQTPIGYLYDSPNTMTDNSGQPFPSTFNLFNQSNQNDFDHLGDNNSYSDWPDHQGGT